MFEQYGGFFTIADESSPQFEPLTATSLTAAFPARVFAVDQALPQPPHLKPAERERVIASVAHQGWMARLLSPALAARVTGISSGLLWHPDATSFFSLALDPAAEQDIGALRDFSQYVNQAYGVSMTVLEGNAASALNSAAHLMAAESKVGDSYQAASDLMNKLQLGDQCPSPHFHRKSCCLIYKLAPPTKNSLCGDCVLRATG